MKSLLETIQNFDKIERNELSFEESQRTFLIILQNLFGRIIIYKRRQYCLIEVYIVFRDPIDSQPTHHQIFGGSGFN